MDPIPSVAVVYGSNFGDTAAAARRIADVLGRRLGKAVPCLDVAAVDLERLRGLDLLVAGTSTWHGGEPQDDWADALPRVAALDWSGTCVALFGLGDQVGYADTFVDALADLAAAFAAGGARRVGDWSATGYVHTHSRAERGGSFVGLALDVEHPPEHSERWCDAVLAEVRATTPRRAAGSRLR
jgi:flavodoxin I